MDTNNLLELHGITKRFAGVVANDDVDLDIARGEIHALLGENGAGKSTLMNIVYGIYRPDAGQAVWKGASVSPQSPVDAIGLGIGMVHQNFRLITSLTVAENVMLGRPSSRAPFFDAKAARETVNRLAEQVNLRLDPKARVWQLSAGAQQWVEIIRALSLGVELLILDEPTSVLTPQETAHLFRTVRELVARGMSVCLITHKLDEVLAVADRVTVLRQGQVQRTAATRGADKAQLARWMVGRDVDFCLEKPACVAGKDVLRLEKITTGGSRRQRLLRQVSLSVRRGEIVGVAGVSGNGQTELGEVIAGLRRVASGRFWVNEIDLTGASPRQIIQAGTGFVPDRPSETATLRDFDLEQNAILRSQWDAPVAQRGVLRPKAITERTMKLMEKYDVRASCSRALASELSGGNLQKLVLARELSRDPLLIVAMNPTAGLDIGAREYIHCRLLEARNQGRGVLLISADLDEVLALSDRVLVMYEGEIVGEVNGPDAHREQVGLMMAGVRS